MRTQQIGAAYAVADPTAAGAWFADHLGFRVLVDLVRRDHDMWPEPSERISGALLALLVEDVDAEHAWLSAVGAEVLMPLVTEPWGQRRFQVAGPDPEWMAAQGLG